MLRSSFTLSFLQISLSLSLSLSLNLIVQAHKCCCSRVPSVYLCVLNDCCCLRAFCAPKIAATTTDTAAGGVDMQLKSLARTSMAAPRGGGPTGHSYYASGYYCGPRKEIALLLRVFTKIGVHHTVKDFAPRGKEPKHEVHIYTWQDTTLRELTDLLGEVQMKEVAPAARKQDARLSFAFVYPDR
ncbi:hypothetical protein BDL97_16G054100 [Sphagnum fallax]|nr:hypothetical protein BDL97_16G054100 [Sphagnum fallax]KAH8937896.1 hypothetical protein BDL97_16G054100 [Sphagnum fallax]KAH8937897.1 hypothetical protein BDL97_16G054100 [Sphagnum fallax]